MPELGARHRAAKPATRESFLTKRPTSAFRTYKAVIASSSHHLMIPLLSRIFSQITYGNCAHSRRNPVQLQRLFLLHKCFPASLPYPLTSAIRLASPSSTSAQPHSVIRSAVLYAEGQNGDQNTPTLPRKAWQSDRTSSEPGTRK